MSQKIRTAIIGYGRNGEAMHGQAIFDSEKFAMVAVADINADARGKAEEKFNCNVYENYHQMLESGRSRKNDCCCRCLK
jgi:predicted dehydrogenase